MVDENRLPEGPVGRPQGPSNLRILLFVFLLSSISALLLAIVSYSLSGAQERAKSFDQSKQMLIADHILDYSGAFEIKEGEQFVPALFDREAGVLKPAPSEEARQPATGEEIAEISRLRIRPLLVDSKGASSTFAEKKIDLAEYLAENKKEGYGKQPLKLIYAILPNEKESGSIDDAKVAADPTLADSFVLPISGFGLWAPVYGYLAIEKDGETVIGTTWYEMAETPGLGANITEPWWQKQFYNKVIFQSGSATIDYNSDPIGLTVVKGQVKNVYGESPRARSAVDGISGSTLTGDGVTAAYRDSLTPYRAFFIRLHEAGKETKEKSG